MAKSERRSKATIFFNMYRVKHIVRYDEQTICKDGTIIEPWHHVVITKNNTAVIYVWDTRKVEHVIDAHNLVGTPVLAKEFDNYEPLIGYGKTDKHVNAEDLLS